MTTEFKTSITSMERYVEDGFVYSVVWEMKAQKDNITVSRPGQVSFTRVEGVEITAFEQLTEAEIIEWVTDNSDPDYFATIRESLTQQLDMLTEPKTWATGLPWQSGVV